MLGDLVICAPVVLREAARCAGRHPHIGRTWWYTVYCTCVAYDHGNKTDAQVMVAREARVLRRARCPKPLQLPDAIMNKDDDHTVPVPPVRCSLLDSAGAALMGEPGTRAEVVEVLRAAQARDILDRDSLDMIEGVFQVSEMKVRDIMVPRGQMDVVVTRTSHRKPTSRLSSNPATRATR